MSSHHSEICLTKPCTAFLCPTVSRPASFLCFSSCCHSQQLSSCASGHEKTSSSPISASWNRILEPSSWIWCDGALDWGILQAECSKHCPQEIHLEFSSCLRLTPLTSWEQLAPRSRRSCYLQDFAQRKNLPTSHSRSHLGRRLPKFLDNLGNRQPQGTSATQRTKLGDPEPSTGFHPRSWRVVSLTRCSQQKRHSEQTPLSLPFQRGMCVGLFWLSP